MAKTIKKNNKTKNKDRRETIKENEKVTSITYTDGISVNDLAEKLHKQSSEIIKALFMMGKMVTINSTLDDESVELVCM